MNQNEIILAANSVIDSLNNGIPYNGIHIGLELLDVKTEEDALKILELVKKEYPKVFLDKTIKCSRSDSFVLTHL